MGQLASVDLRHHNVSHQQVDPAFMPLDEPCGLGTISGGQHVVAVPLQSSGSQLLDRLFIFQHALLKVFDSAFFAQSRRDDQKGDVFSGLLAIISKASVPAQLPRLWSLRIRLYPACSRRRWNAPGELTASKKRE